MKNQGKEEGRGISASRSHPLVSVVVPVYNEEESTPALLQAMEDALRALGTPFEVVLVDDHSLDNTPHLLKEACHKKKEFRYLRLSRNRGSHIAILAGMAHARGDCCVFLAADLQDPPGMIKDLVFHWSQGSDIVWAVRAKREKLSRWDWITSTLYHRLLGMVTAGLVPPKGSDFALLDRKVVKALLESCGLRPSIGIEIARLGFRQTQVPYTKQAREFGTSKWTLRRKLAAVVDAMIHTRSPLLVTWSLAIPLGVVGGLAAAVVLILAGVFGYEFGWQVWLAILLVILCAAQMVMVGVTGEYLSRLLEESSRPPLYVVQDRENLDVQDV